MIEKIIQHSEKVIKQERGEIVRQRVEDTLNALLDIETVHLKVCNMKYIKQISMVLFFTLFKSLSIPGYINILLAIVTKTNLHYNYWWLVSTIGLFLSMVFLILVILNILKNKPSPQTLNSQIRSSYLRQIVFSFVIIGLSLGFGIFSTIIALFALNKAVNASIASDDSMTVSKLINAKKLNIIAIFLVGVRWLAIVLFIESIHKAG